MKFKIKTIYGKNSNETYINELDARTISTNYIIDRAIDTERDNNGLDGTEIKITNTMSLIIIQDFHDIRKMK